MVVVWPKARVVVVDEVVVEVVTVVGVLATCMWLELHAWSTHLTSKLG